jgi:hypothetical protein
MQTVKITQDFDGYPSGSQRRSFTAGEVVQVSDDYAEILFAKGFAKASTAKDAPKASATIEPTPVANIPAPEPVANPTEGAE